MASTVDRMIVWINGAFGAGGSGWTNAELGARAWPHLLQALRLNE